MLTTHLKNVQASAHYHVVMCSHYEILVTQQSPFFFLLHNARNVFNGFHLDLREACLLRSHVLRICFILLN